jgi:hypothetical protein
LTKLKKNIQYWKNKQMKRPALIVIGLALFAHCSFIKDLASESTVTYFRQSKIENTAPNVSFEFYRHQRNDVSIENRGINRFPSQSSIDSLLIVYKRVNAKNQTVEVFSFIPGRQLNLRVTEMKDTLHVSYRYLPDTAWKENKYSYKMYKGRIVEKYAKVN